MRRQPTTGSGAGGEPPDDEYAIVLRALVDRKAFAPLYERYLNPIHGYCYRRLGSREAAEDATAVVFRKALEGLHSFHGGSFRAWIYTIADNVLRDQHRAAHPTAPLLDDYDPPDPEPGPEERAIAAFDREELRRALVQLPEEWRRVVELRVAGYSCAEVAELIGGGRSVAWVRQIHHRAMERLRQLLRDRSDEKGGAT